MNKIENKKVLVTKSKLRRCLQILKMNYDLSFSEMKEQVENILKSKVVNVSVKFIRPQYKDLKDWTLNENNVYIGRGGIVFIKNGDKKERFPKRDSIWANPFKVGDDRKTCLEKYEEYIREKLKNPEMVDELKKLKGKQLGCWCKPQSCHGDILLKLIYEL